MRDRGDITEEYKDCSAYVTCGCAGSTGATRIDRRGWSNNARGSSEKHRVYQKRGESKRYFQRGRKWGILHHFASMQE